MIVKCIANTGKDLSENSIKAGEFRFANFGLKIGKAYIVYSMFLLRGALQYLLSEKPAASLFWYPVELFEVIDPLLPLEWYFLFRGYEEDPQDQNPVSALWGYKEMICDPNHYIDLFEREPEALDIFFKRKREIDEYHDLSKFMRKNKESIL